MPISVHLVAATFVLIAAGYAISIPPWNNPDEPAHFNYVRELAANGTLPVLRPGAWDSELLERLKTSRFRDANIDSITYEAHQPPLYYALEVPGYLATRGLTPFQQVLVLRGLSIVLGTALVYLTARLALVMAPARADIATTAAGFAAFLPMHTYMAAAINNDALGNLIGGALVLAAASGIQRGFGTRARLILGGLIGLALITKTTTYALIPVALAAFSYRRRLVDKLSWVLLFAEVGSVAGIALLVGGWWFARNGLIYGWDDLLATRHHDAVVVGQLRSDDPTAPAVDARISSAYQSFWGVFGWMGVPFQQPTYAAYSFISLLIVLGIPALVAQPPPSSAANQLSPHRASAVVLLAATAATMAAFVGYNLTFVQSQARYLFPSLAGVATLFALAVATFRQAASSDPSRAPRLSAAGGPAAAWLVAFATSVGSRGVFPWTLVAVAGALGVAAVMVFLEKRRFRWAGMAQAAVTVAGLAWADIALLVGVAIPAFR
ncbi:MAG: hypothetical protein A3F84_28170 [Candidatus Handelsmanbacteria bacterium RIFCSPLOWO2_12_FULL_64_10]|uniref:Glycosyltransferase RgtA/B/C/D-like domain-containing protein n=1 Tax=Handelsmanbacteria sp. (strain RIFCSPLOWO2_12_FULL_64_10) TaxID=1817868 RepID=A0A1F6CHS1_HANXR|nr:MAG: hypothetical protein A3F84_28170 [Candidatus Handelsmanbacteria bacterium RIFCSPLOWO2_12_FULL_64_10]